MKSHPYAAEPWLRPLHDTMSCYRSSRLRGRACLDRGKGWEGMGVRGKVEPASVGVGRDGGNGKGRGNGIGIRGGDGNGMWIRGGDTGWKG